MSAAHLQNLSRQHAFLNALMQRCGQDKRILAAWLEGSLARASSADRYSDVDLHLLVGDEDEQAVRGQLEGLLNELQPVLYFRPLPLGSMVAMVLFDNLLQLEVWIESGEQWEIPEGFSEILFDPNNALQTAPQVVGSDDVARQLDLRIRDLWYGVSSLPKVARGELIPVVGHLHRQAEWLAEVMVLGRGSTRSVGSSRVTEGLSEEEKEALAQALTLPDMTTASVIKAHMHLAQLVGSFGRLATARQGVPYPEHLEQTVLNGVWAELRTMDLAENQVDVEDSGLLP